MNPYPKTIIDEDSGREIPNFKHKIWEEGARFERERIIAILWGNSAWDITVQRFRDIILEEIGIET